MAILTNSPSPDKKNPDWGLQVKTGRGRSDVGAHHRAIDVAWKLFERGAWDGRGLLIVHDAYETHAKVQLFGDAAALVEGVDFEFGEDTTYRRPAAAGEPDAVDEVAGRMAARHPEWQATIETAAELARTGKVQHTGPGAARVTTRAGAVFAVGVRWDSGAPVCECEAWRERPLLVGNHGYCEHLIAAAIAAAVEGATSDERRVTSGEAARRPATLDEALAEMVARGKASRPGLEGRLAAAAGLVRMGRVVLGEAAAARIGPYTIGEESCTCGDFTHRGGWCKHRLAVRMARHLVASGFALPEAGETPAGQQISAANRRLIESGAVVDAERKSRQAYLRSSEAARHWALTAMSNGAGTLPAEIARRAGIARDK